MPLIVNDFEVFFEIDGYTGLKNYENVKHIKIDLGTALAYSKKTVEYSKLLLENKIMPQSVMIYPSLMN